MLRKSVETPDQNTQKKGTRKRVLALLQNNRPLNKENILLAASECPGIFFSSIPRLKDHPDFPDALARAVLACMESPGIIFFHLPAYTEEFDGLEEAFLNSAEKYPVTALSYSEHIRGFNGSLADKVAEIANGKLDELEKNGKQQDAIAG